MSHFSMTILQGDKQLFRAMGRLANAVERDVMRKAIRAGAKPMVRAIRQAMPVGPTKNLKKSIGRRPKTYRNTGTVIEVIGARMPKGAHAHWLEFGTADRYHKPKGAIRKMFRMRGKYTGRMPKPAAGPLKRAFDTTVMRTATRISRVAFVELAKALRKV